MSPDLSVAIKIPSNLCTPGYLGGARTSLKSKDYSLSTPGHGSRVIRAYVTHTVRVWAGMYLI